ncbi:MAG: class I adenylate-forming enzyme family protein [Acidimicrobiales bacterium]|nr:class I adenylate-forming enzyme family protein [Acidimicrobiales bacterium]
MIDVLQATWEELTAPGAQFAYSEQEVRGMTMRVFDGAPPDMRFLWEMSAGFGDKPYIVFEDERITYAEAHAAVRSLAHHLVDNHGVGKGDRVAIAMRNYPEWAIAYWATISIGAAAVGVNAWWTSQELEYGLGDSRPKVIIADDERLERLLPVLDGLRADGRLDVISVRSDRELPADGHRWTDVVDPANAPAELPPADIHPDDDMCIFYTSGTTGFPKGAQLTHRGSVHNVLHLAFANTTAAVAAAKVAAAEGKEEEKATEADPAIMVPTPLFHVTANNCVLHPGTLTGAKLVFMHKWDPARAIELIEREKVATFTGVPTMSREMLLHPDWATRDTSTLASMGGGGAALQPDLVEKIDESKGAVKPSTGYGLTETHGIITAVGNMFFSARPTSAGLVMPTFYAKVVDEAGNEVPRGERGELCVKGPAVVKGYLNRPEATAEAIVDGWFHTGDIVYLDEDDFVHIVDRAKDMVLRGGENVYCAEVEAAIYEHPDVAEAAVFGVPDERLGEAVGVAIFPREGTTIDAEQLRAHLEPRLAKFKIPEHVWVRDEPLPQNANGKFLKRDLRDQLAPPD